MNKTQEQSARPLIEALKSVCEARTVVCLIETENSNHILCSESNLDMGITILSAATYICNQLAGELKTIQQAQVETKGDASGE
jgi:hypothetical protein